MFRCPQRSRLFQKASWSILHRRKLKCRRAALAIKNREVKSRPSLDQLLTCDDLKPQLTCYLNEKIEMSAKFMPDGTKQASGRVGIDFLYDIAKSHPLISNIYSPWTVEMMISVLQSRYFSIQVCRTKITNIAESIALLSSENQVSY